MELDEARYGVSKRLLSAKSRPSVQQASCAQTFTRLWKKEDNMIRKLRTLSLVAILVAIAAFNVVVPATAVASDLPCYDLWAGCLAGGGSENFCEGMWCACMFNTYGYICNAQIS